MLLAGDEIGHTQQGNNNAYCQDNELSWLNWDLNEEQQALLAFVRKCIAFVNAEPVLQRRRFFHGHAIHGGEAPEIAWLDTTGKEMSDEDWSTSFVRSFGVELFGDNVDTNEHGERISGDTLLLMFNADHATQIDFVLPELEAGERWLLVLDTALPQGDSGRTIDGAHYPLEPCSLAVLRLAVGEQAAAPQGTKPAAKTYEKGTTPTQGG